ncbi:nickel-binding protein [Robertkochia solimangrovi]|uniref:nickel-binding protein n=1 Tax=Robertkochia solimangrovi TaxID=2213046 RepID=UPI001180AED0|nr:nickel-binding protein [Robertkochia solimangrovi]TRZ45792.1 hypothetical protein DMZ48_00495 [Robertkochia solimangrovi]
MPLFMDLHHVEQVKPVEVAEAHLLDLKIQQHYNCNAMTYWMDQSRGKVFCLIEAPDRESVIKLHSDSHGLVPHDIIEVDESLVQGFLGRLNDPTVFEMRNGAKVFEDSAYRFLLVVHLEPQVLMENRTDKETALNTYNEFHRLFSEIAHGTGGTIAPGSSEYKVISFKHPKCAVHAAELLGDRIGNFSENVTYRIVLHGGEPVEGSRLMFGSSIEAAENLYYYNGDSCLIASNLFLDEAGGDDLKSVLEEMNFCFPDISEEKFFHKLMKCIREHIDDPEFTVQELSLMMYMSTSKLYRRCKQLSGLSPNNLIRDIRLEFARRKLESCEDNIASVLFGHGFNSPSYFTKCFHSRFGISPRAYKNALV